MMNFFAAIKFDPTLGEARAALLAITEAAKWVSSLYYYRGWILFIYKFK